VFHCVQARRVPHEIQKEPSLTRGVFPTAPTKPSTECDVKVLESIGFNAASLEEIMIVGKDVE